MAEQRILTEYDSLGAYLSKLRVKSIFLVCGNSFDGLQISQYINEFVRSKGIRLVRFGEFSPNPQFESVQRGVQLFRAEDCDVIMAVGGGSAMDVAKCIKLYSNSDADTVSIAQEIVPNEIPLIVIPTTAGTGSEVTRYSVVYVNGEKHSVTHESSVPTAIMYDESALNTLPDYHKKSSMLDALCHAIESFWSVNSTKESKEDATKAIRAVLENKTGYLQNAPEGNKNMLLAASLAGRAINITQTTAGHAMCYKLTTMYGLAHGHAAALCVVALWTFMLQHVGDCKDTRGVAYMKEMFDELALAMGVSDAWQAPELFGELLHELNMAAPGIKEKELKNLCKSVNVERLKNNPINLEEKDIEYLYRQIACL